MTRHTTNTETKHSIVFKKHAFSIFVVLAQATWGYVMLWAALLKFFEFGPLSYVKHYTNWSWTLQLIYYIISSVAPLLVAYKERGWPRRATRAFVAIVFVPLNGVVWVVAALVAILLLTGSPFLAAALNNHQPSLVFLGNDVYHYVPVIALLIYFIINWRFVFYSTNWLVRRSPFLMILYLSFGGTLITLLAYSVFFDPRDVYSTDISLGSGVFFIFGILTLVNLTPLIAAYYFFDLGRRKLDDAWLDSGIALIS